MIILPAFVIRGGNRGILLLANHKLSSSNEAKQPGFFYGYIIIIISFITLVISFGILSSFGVFFKPLLNEFGWTRAATSGAFSLCSIIQGLLGIAMGGITDRFGPRVVI